MSSSRNKRKRAEGELPAAMAMPQARRRSREGLSGAEPTDPEAAATKNEGEDNSNSATTCTLVSASATNTGESSADSGTTIQPQHSQVAPTVQNPVVAAALLVPKQEGKKRESETNARNKPLPTNEAMVKRDAATRNSTTARSAAAAAAAASTAVLASQDADGSTARSSKIKSIISHRKLLLDRVRSGRSAVRGRVVDMARNEAQAAKQATANVGESARGNTALPSKPAPLSEKARDEAEVVAFKKLSKSALQTAKKQRAENSEGAAQEKRSSVSLRRGASVGKKMNAALSTLVPDRTGTAAVPGADPAQPLHVASTAGEKATTQVVGQPAPLPTQKLTSTAPVRYPTHQSAGQPTGKKLKVIQNQTVKAPAAAEAIPKIVRSGSQKNIKSSDVTATRGTSSNTGAVAQGQPLHAGLNTLGLPTNRLAHQVPAVCQKALALREKEKSIQAKLAALLQKRNNKRDHSDGPGRDSVPSALGTQSPMSENAKKIAYAASASKKLPEPPSHLPRRRKTHWDNLLQEMKWMATDFAEERKWKTSAARTLGSAVQSAGTGVIKSKITEDISTSRDSGEPHSKHTNGQSKETLPATKPIMPAAKKPNEATSAPAMRESLYQKPTIDDTSNVKRVASNLASEIGNAMLRPNAWSPALEGQPTPGKGGETSVGTAIAAPTSTAAQCKGVAPVEGIERSKAQLDNDNKSQTGSFKRISKAVDNLLESFNSSPRRPPKRKSTSGGKENRDDFALTSKQLEVIDFVEKKWGQSKSGAGAILTGSKASGKTTAVCSLLWKHRTNGAQLLVCSPYRVPKWTHELKSFQPLTIKAIGIAAGISPPSDFNEVASFKSNEVVVCEFSALQRLTKADFDRFDTVVIDCRYPQGFVGSRWPSDFDRKSTEGQRPIRRVPPELITESWWEKLVENIGKTSLNCMIIDNPGPLTFLDDCIDKTEMQRVELISLRAAFILGARLFSSPNSSVKKRILTWARRRTKGSTKSTTNKVNEVHDFFLELMRPFSHEVNNDNNLELVSHKEAKRLDLEFRPCSLSSADRAEYDKSCTALRGALSFNINKAGESNLIRAQNHRAISDALLCLRRLCFHSKLSSLLKSTTVRHRLGSPSYPNGDSTVQACGSRDHRMLRRKVNDSASQTDMDLASTILEGSAKLRELVSILRNECDYKIADEDAIASFLKEPDKPRRAKQGTDHKSAKLPKKVVILAVLPEVQIILSVLLNCIGLAHELLLRPSRYFCPSESDIKIGLPEKQATASTLAWIECQQALSRFNTPHSQKSGATLNVLVASPDMIAGDHGGIGIDLADFVISIDEDWSGRNELIMRSLVAGLIPRNLRAKDKGCQVLKLVCENTCEENFLSAGTEGAKVPLQPKEQAASWPWPLDLFGRFVTSDMIENQQNIRWPEREHKEAIFAFPALNLFRFRNQALSDVLGVENLPPLLGLGSSILFLPQESLVSGEDSGGQRTAEISLVKHMMETEDSAHSIFKEAGIVTSSPCSSRDFATTRQGVPILATRLYLEQFQNSEQKDSSTEQGVPTVSLSGGVEGSVNPASSSLVDNSDIAASFQADCGPNVGSLSIASSLLLYNPLTDAQPKSNVRGKGEAKQAALSLLSAGRAASSPRANRYASAFLFNSDLNLRDGKQGSEPLVYFPPLFPRLLNCSIQAKRDMDAIRAKTSRGTAGTTKRPVEASADSVAKRLKVNTSMAPFGIVDSANSSLLPHASSSPAVAGMPAAITEDEASHSDAATVLLDLDEDFGLAGIGAIPLPKDAVLESAATYVEVSNSALDPDHMLLQNEWSEGLPPCDIEELESFRMSRPTGVSLNSVLLFTGRKKRQYSPLLGTSPVYRPPPTNSDVGWPATAVSGPGNGVFHEMNGMHTSAKKSKKKAATPVGSGALARPGDVVHHGMTQVPLSVQMVKAKDMYRNRIVAFISARQKAMGMSLFDSPAYCFAAVRFRNLFNDRVPRMSWALFPSQKIGPGLPMMPEAGFADYSESQCNLWTSIVKRLKTQVSTTGDDARALAEAQRSSLRRSLSAPSRVDFGPFQCGFLLSLSGMTGISPPRSRSGVSLPMGVKIPLGREQQQRAWSEDEDRTLRECTGQYGMNWILASRVLSGLDDVVNSNQSPSCRRSARNCRDRWQALARVDLSLAKEVRLAEQSLRESSNLRAAVISDETESSIRLGGPSDEKATEDNGAEPEFLMPLPAKTQDANDDTGDNSKMDVEPGDNDKMDTGDHNMMHLDELDDPLSMDIDLPGDSGVLGSITMEDVGPVGHLPEELKGPKKAFGFLLTAKAKRQVVPMTIPGVVPGSQPSFVASHPSHQQSVQSSVAATWTNGRTEMWPLQFLDVAEKRRNAAAATSAEAATKSSSSSGARSPTASRSPLKGASGARAPVAGAPRVPGVPGRVPTVACGRAPPASGRPPPVSNASRGPGAPSTGRAASNSGRPPSAASASRASTGAPRGASVPGMARAPSSGAARAPGGHRPHPAANTANHNRAQKPGVASQPYGSPVMKYPPHPQGGHYAPPPGHPHAHPHPGAHPHAASPHHPHHPHHQRMAPSPASRTPRAPAAQPKYAAHTPVAHSQNIHPEAAKAKAVPAPASSARTSSGSSGANRPPTKSTSKPAAQQPKQQQPQQAPTQQAPKQQQPKQQQQQPQQAPPKQQPPRQQKQQPPPQQSPKQPPKPS